MARGPDFLCIGAQKAGTTWLFRQLSRHPQIVFPAGKEVHFWDRRYAEGVQWYVAQFAGHEDRITGDVTPAYAILPVERVQQIHELNPELKVIYVLRNPIERAWSAALMALQRAEMTESEASDQWFIDHFRSAGSLSRGDYESCLRVWRSVFETGRILVLRYEMIQHAAREFLQRCCEHIGASPEFFSSVSPERLSERVFSGPGITIRPSLLPILRELYEPRIRSLGAYLGEDLSAWLK
ncbi:MAG TPA: sulfotransferase [Gammaproteobacteria bacterium]|nr:sulfotransferase [Gammaproteobacteria bacterium]